MNDALVVYIHQIMTKWGGQGRENMDIDKYMEWHEIPCDGTFTRQAIRLIGDRPWHASGDIVGELMPTSAGMPSPRFPQQQNGQQKTKKTPQTRLGSLQGNTLRPVPGILWPNAQRRDGLTHTFDEQERLTGEIRNTRENSKEQGSGTNSLWEFRSRIQAGIT